MTPTYGHVYRGVRARGISRFRALYLVLRIAYYNAGLAQYRRRTGRPWPGKATP